MIPPPACSVIDLPDLSITLLKIMPRHTHKLDDLILYLGSSPHVENLGITKLWKLIYFIDVAFLRETGASLTGSEYDGIFDEAEEIFNDCAGKFEWEEA
jgi:hypothetical protein